MTIYVTPKADLVALLGSQATDTFAETDFIFGVPHPATSEEQTARQRNTRINVSFSPASVKGQGWQPFYYDRLNIASLSNAQYGLSFLNEGDTEVQVVAALRKWTGAVVPVSDLVPHAAVQNAETGSVTFLVEVKPESLGWHGSFTLTSVGTPHISTAFNDDKLDGF